MKTRISKSLRHIREQHFEIKEEPNDIPRLPNVLFCTFIDNTMPSIAKEGL